ncbi:MAG TPA: hypothetical protein VNQ76_20575, partial [Planctomicrobium sp.]|nr:hypothetical protein [Planctomicrobium sp.]
SSASAAEQIPLPELPMPVVALLQSSDPEPAEQSPVVQSPVVPAPVVETPVVTQPEAQQILVAQQVAPQALPQPINDHPPIALPVAPPPAVDAPSDSDLDSEARLARRVAELNQPLTRIDLAAVTMDGPQPKDLAATQSSQLPPILVWGGDGWAEPRADRYPEYFAYQPLYFEDRNLERCGEGHGFAQPLFSSAHFLKNTIALPYHLIASPPRSMVQTPGDCPTCYRFPHTMSE